MVFLLNILLPGVLDNAGQFAVACWSVTARAKKTKVHQGAAKTAKNIVLTIAAPPS